MRQLLFITIMTTMLSPLAMFQSDDPFRKLGKMPASIEKVEAVRIVSQQVQRLYGRVENTIVQHVNVLADAYLGQS
jgi:hypothetical protein